MNAGCRARRRGSSWSSRRVCAGTPGVSRRVPSAASG
jgi:hypothetical protein